MTLRIARSCSLPGSPESRDLTFTGENDLLYRPVGSSAFAAFKQFKLLARYLTLLLARVSQMMGRKFMQMGTRSEPATETDSTSKLRL